MTKETYIRAEFQGTYNDKSFVGIENAKKYINNWDKWLEIFPEEIINRLVNEVIKISDVCAIQYVPTSANSGNFYETHYTRLPEIKRNHKFIEIWGEWTRDHYEDAYQYIVPLTYQSVYLRKAFNEAILMAYPYLKKYKFDAYVPTYGSGSCDIYIKMPYKYNGEEVTVSLYCPLKALLEKNPEMIYQRHFGYNSNYYKNQPETKDKILGVLNSQKYKAFCKKVKEG